ncbi:MOSC domain-containing protein [Antrihabitans sp. NCIMB 15449]|uniref:MOSC domain-containing protein n=1 Tax=Antrihabitans spumae TaxID=3373370 RepID=A0ABW7JGL9_9NOCA
MSAPLGTVGNYGSVRAVCVVFADIPQPRAIPITAIDKRPVSGPVRIEPLGPEGDHVCDTKHHGGLDQAVYVYGEDEAQRWSDELGKPVPPGWFGENLRVSGLPVTDAVIGERWRIGSVLLQATAPRIPCVTFQIWTGEKHWVRRFAERADVGAYFRVLEPGTISAGDSIEIVEVPAHGITVRDLFVATDADRLARLLDESSLSDGSRYLVDAALRRLDRRKDSSR